MKVKPIGEHEQMDVTMPGAAGTRMRMLIGPGDGAKTFHMRHFEVQPGGHTPHHQHDYEHEILVLEGRGIATGEQDKRPFKAGDVVWVPASEKHQLRNTGPQPLQFICLIPARRDDNS